MKQESKLEEMLPIFVYGTLLPGQPNAHLWDGHVVEQEPATLPNGRLYDMGHFPMLIDDPNSQVRGVVLFIDPANYQEVLECLDNLEGFVPEDPENCPYQRVRRRVQAENGRTRTAWVYLGLPDLVAGQPPIPEGDWAVFAAAKSQEIDGWWSDIDSVHDLF